MPTLPERALGSSLSANSKMALTSDTLEVPVMPLSGLSRSAMRPAATGSVTLMKIMGVVMPALVQAWAAGVAMGTMTS